MTDIIGPNLTSPSTAADAKPAQGERVVLEAEAQLETLPDAIKARVQATQEAAAARQDQVQQQSQQPQEQAQQQVQNEQRAETQTRQVRAEGRVVERLDNGDYIVRTPEGDIVLRPVQTTETPRPEAPVRVDFPPAVNSDVVTVQVTVRATQLEGAPLRSTATPLDVTIAPPALPDTQVAAPLPAITVRLEALPADFTLPPFEGLVQNFAFPPLTLTPLAPLVDSAPLTAPLTAPLQSAAPLAYNALTDLSALTLSPPNVPAHIVQHLVQPDKILVDLPATPAPALPVLPTQQTLLNPPAVAPIAPNLQPPAPLAAPSSGILEATFVQAEAQPLINTPILAGDVPLIITGQKQQGTPIVQLPATPAPNLKAPLHTLNQPLETPTQFFLLHGLTFDQPAGQIVKLSPQISAAPIEMDAPLALIPQTVPAIKALAPYFLTTDSWPVMEALHQDLARISTQTAQSFSAMIPSPANNPAQLMPALLFFVAAMRSGDMSSWLGEKASTLLKAATDGKSLSRLTGEGELLSRLATERSSAEWRSLPLPFYQDEQFRKVLLHVREEPHHQESTQQKGKNVRFLFDLALDNMGDVQLDGLFHGSGRLDLIVRTQQHFSQAMQQEMRRLYAGAIEQAGVHGELSFQNSLQQWVTIDYQAATFGAEA